MTTEEMAIKIAEYGQRLIGAEHRIKDLEETQKSIGDLTISVKELAISVKNMTEEQKEQGTRIKALESEPADKWKTMTKSILTSLISVAVGAIITALIAL